MVDRTFIPNDSDRDKAANSDQPAAPRSSHNTKGPSDEIIVSLANTYENKRARQVIEWERVQPANVRRSV
jgi:hypothetical protein